MNLNADTNSEKTIGIFKNAAAAEEAISDLKLSGFSEEQIRIFKRGKEKDAPFSAADLGIAATGGMASTPGMLADSERGITSGTEGLVDLTGALNLAEAATQNFSGELESRHLYIAVDAGPHAAIARAILERNGGEIKIFKNPTGTP